MTADKSQYNIMVIEDNPGDFALVEDFIFEHIEAPVIIRAVNYASADKILIANNVPFDIILLDLSLPDLTGLELIKAILNLAHNTPVIVLTGYSDFAFGVKSLSLGVADYILKDDLTSLALYKSIVYSVERKGIVLALEESEKRVRAFATQLNNALEEERSRIAREIHDEFGQQLSGLKMSLSSLRKIKDVPEELINAMVADVDVSIQSVRQIANELRPVLIDRLGLFAALEWLVTEFEKKTGIASYLYINASAPAIDKMLGINIFRICQEAMTNIVKHAKAKIVKIYIENQDQNLNIKITDNGKGIKSTTLHNPFSMGLLNMRERANMIGGQLKIESSKKGTIIELIIPV